MDMLTSLLYGGVGGTVVVWLLRNWIAERLKRAIQHEYAAKLETLKADLNARLSAVAHDYEIHQLRTSLFFEHRRLALATVSSAIVKMRDQWIAEGYDFETQVVDAVPQEPRNRLRSVFYEQQLFLDRVSVAAVELVIDTAQRSFPSDDDNVGEYRRDADSALEQITYLLPLLADVFRGRLGLEPSGDAERRLGLLGAIQLLNHYHFQDIGLPPKGDLELDADRAADAVVKAEKHVGSLLAKLKEFRTYLREHNLGVFHAAATDIERYIEILEAHPAPAGGVAA